MLVPQSSIPITTRLLVKANPSQHLKNSSTQKSPGYAHQEFKQIFPRAKLLSRGKQALGVWTGYYWVGAIKQEGTK